MDSGPRRHPRWRLDDHRPEHVGGIAGLHGRNLTIAVTTTRDASAPLHERAALLAARFASAGVPAVVVNRRSFRLMQEEVAGDAVYVVGRVHDSVVIGDGTPAFVQQGLLRTKFDEGRRHPFIRAVHGAGEAKRVLDLTTGLGGDAMHVACSLGPDGEVVCCEGSVIVHALLEEGLGRLARDEAFVGLFGTGVQRMRLWDRAADHLEVLRALPDDAFDAVLIDPMMRRPLKATASFEAIRRFGIMAPPGDDAFIEARRVAKRVVLKLGQAQDPPVDLTRHGFNEVLVGTHLVYHVASRSR